MKVVYVSRHELLPAQKKAVKIAGFQIVDVVPTLPEPYTEEFHRLVKKWREMGVEGVLTIALPPHLLNALSTAGFRIFILKMRAIGTTTSEKEAKEWVSKAPEKRVVLLGAMGERTYRLLEFDGIYEVKIQIEEKPIVVVT